MARAKKKEVDRTKANILVQLFGGDRQLFPPSFESLIRVTDGNQRLLSPKTLKGNSFLFHVPFNDNLVDNYTVLVTADDHVDAGFTPVKVNPDLDQHADLMLLSDGAKFQFARWAEIKQNHPAIVSFLCCGQDETNTKNLFAELVEIKPAAAASLLNLATAMSTIHLPAGSPLTYFKEILWDDSLAADRFFGYADAELINQVKIAAQQGSFAPEPSPGLFHPDATSSFKQVQFGEANVQLTFHEKDKKTIDGVKCIKVEPDIDYFKDLGAHALFEVIPNSITHGHSNPKEIYMLRWIAGRHAGVPEFDPPYTLG